ncbi:MAG: Stp1/IreP family PP2C-type Ser/Thr phosphatase [Clostridia bacterium]|nr:Stp1/IreP family PP2C-type Ser/Thr phosphatase [Clostridia bacterium]
MIHGRTDVGQKRDLNEDSFAFEKLKKGYVMIVSDGMGGHNAGEVASAMAVEKIREFCETQDMFSNPEMMLRKAVSYANEAIYNASVENAKMHGMGATLVVALGYGKNIYIANVGDSRAYHITKESMTQVTQDHSYVYELVKSGLITPEEAKIHPRRNEITKALGIAPEVYPDIFPIQVQRTDKLLLCTDGLTEVVSEQEIFETVNRLNRQTACDTLVRRANENGGPDNITVVLM